MNKNILKTTAVAFRASSTAPTPRPRGVSLHLHVYIHLCTYTVYTCILEAYTVYRTGHMLSKQCNEESFLWMARP